MEHALSIWRAKTENCWTNWEDSFSWKPEPGAWDQPQIVVLFCPTAHRYGVYLGWQDHTFQNRWCSVVVTSEAIYTVHVVVWGISTNTPNMEIKSSDITRPARLTGRHKEKLFVLTPFQHSSWADTPSGTPMLLLLWFFNVGGSPIDCKTTALNWGVSSDVSL